MKDGSIKFEKSTQKRAL